MSHFPKPYFKASRQTWYAGIDCQQHALGNYPQGLPQPQRGRGDQSDLPPDSRPQASEG